MHMIGFRVQVSGVRVLGCGIICSDYRGRWLELSRGILGGTGRMLSDNTQPWLLCYTMSKISMMLVRDCDNRLDTVFSSRAFSLFATRLRTPVGNVRKRRRVLRHPTKQPLLPDV